MFHNQLQVTVTSTHLLWNCRFWTSLIWLVSVLKALNFLLKNVLKDVIMYCPVPTRFQTDLDVKWLGAFTNNSHLNILKYYIGFTKSVCNLFETICMCSHDDDDDQIDLESVLNLHVFESLLWMGYLTLETAVGNFSLSWLLGYKISIYL